MKLLQDFRIQRPRHTDCMVGTTLQIICHVGKYNACQRIASCIRKTLHMTVDNFELFVVYLFWLCLLWRQGLTLVRLSQNLLYGLGWLQTQSYISLSSAAGPYKHESLYSENYHFSITSTVNIQMVVSLQALNLFLSKVHGCPGIHYVLS